MRGVWHPGVRENRAYCTAYGQTTAEITRIREPFSAFASIACWKVWNFNPPRIGACFYAQKNRTYWIVSTKIIADGEIKITRVIFLLFFFYHHCVPSSSCLTVRGSLGAIALKSFILLHFIPFNPSHQQA